MQATRLDYWVILSLLIFKLLKLCWCKLGVTAAIGIEVWLSVQLKNPISAVGWICFGVNSHCSLPSSKSVPTELAGAFPRQ